MQFMKTHSLYNGIIKLQFNDLKHHYTVDDKTVDGVTSILQVIGKPALVYWSANKASEFINLNLPVGKAIDEIEKQKLVNGCKTAHRTLKEDAGNLGTMFHELVEKFAKGEKYEEPVNEILKKSFDQFKEWVAKNNVEFKSSERVVYSKQYNYAGTLDMTAIVNGKNVLIDLKTSSGIWNEMHLQTAAYRYALQEEFPDIKIDHTVIIRCGKDGVFEVMEMNDFKENFEAFLGALTLYRRLKKMDFDKRKM